MSKLSNYKINRRKYWLRKVLNSYLTPRIFYKYIYSTARWKKLLLDDENGQNPLHEESVLQSTIRRMFYKIVWFYPRDKKDIHIWLNAKLGSRKEYLKFMEISDCDHMFCDLIEQYCPDRSSSILELGSNIGRVLNQLQIRGYKNIKGVELNRHAIEASSSIFGSKVQNSLERNSIQAHLMSTNDKEIDVVITFGATIELIHPAFDVIRNMCRVAKHSIIIFINENQHSYPRFYSREFERWGFYNCFYRRAVGDLCNVNTQNSFLVFNRI